MKTDNKKFFAVISDTHGMLRDSVAAELKKADAVIHCGDIGSKEVLDALKKIAPVFAVQGNTDFGEWTESLPETEIIENEFYVIHDLEMLDLDPVSAGLTVVFHGHTHNASAEYKNGVLFLNPGSASYPRKSKHASIAFLYLNKHELRYEFKDII